MHNLYASPAPDLLSDDGLALTEKTWEILWGRGVDFKLAELEIQPLSQFKEVLASQPQTSEPDRMVIVEQARILFENFYAHLAFKKERLQVDPALAWVAAMLPIKPPNVTQGKDWPIFPPT